MRWVLCATLRSRNWLLVLRTLDWTHKRCAMFRCVLGKAYSGRSLASSNTPDTTMHLYALYALHELYRDIQLAHTSAVPQVVSSWGPLAGDMEAGRAAAEMPIPLSQPAEAPLLYSNGREETSLGAGVVQSRTSSLFERITCSKKCISHPHPDV